MEKTECTKADHIYYGILCAALACVAIAHLIDACRSRPKVKVIMLGVSGKGSNNGDKAKAESSSAAE